MSELTVYKSNAPVATAPEVKAHVDLVQQVMAAVMKADTHYGTIPGTGKPTLYKAGSEVLLTTFRIAVEPEVEDLSDGDHIRFRVRCIGKHQTSGIVVGVGVGEASTAEEKYCWRDAVCPEEFQETPEHRRRVKWQKSRDGRAWKREQVRTNTADLANTVLKMAKKRAQIDLCLTATAASDIFAQDLEDMPPEVRGNAAADESRPAAPAPARKAASNAGAVATDKQVALIRRRLDDAAYIDAEGLCKALGVGAITEIPRTRVDEALNLIAEADK